IKRTAKIPTEKAETGEWKRKKAVTNQTVKFVEEVITTLGFFIPSILKEGQEQRTIFDSISRTKQTRTEMDFRRSSYGRVHAGRRFSGIPNEEWQTMTPSERGNKSMICCRGIEARDLKRIYNEVYLEKILRERGSKEFHCCTCKGLMDINELRNCKRERTEPRISYKCEVCENGKETWYEINKWEITRIVNRIGIKKNWNYGCGCNPNDISTHFGGNERTSRQHCCDKLERGEEVPEEWKRQKVTKCDVCQKEFPRRKNQSGYSQNKSICDLECQVALAAATEAERYSEIREEVRKRTEGSGKRFRNTRSYSNNKTGILRLAGLYFRKNKQGEPVTDEQLKQAKEPQEEDEWTHTGRNWTEDEEIRLHNIMQRIN
ncbi:6595_t:CDS:2, partial [Diversispora eburnea]